MHLAILQPSRLVVKYLHILDMLSSELDEILMRRILAHVVITVLFTIEFHNKTMCKGTLNYPSVPMYPA